MRLAERDRARAQEVRREEATRVPTAASAFNPGTLNFGYKRPRRDRGFPWVPEQVFDDGQRMYVLLPPEATRYPMPVLYEVDARGKYVLVNYAQAGLDASTGDEAPRYLVVDHLLDRAVLMLGSMDGEGPFRLLIEREGQQGQSRGWLSRDGAALVAGSYGGRGGR